MWQSPLSCDHLESRVVWKLVYCNRHCCQMVPACNASATTTPKIIVHSYTPCILCCVTSFRGLVSSAEEAPASTSSNDLGPFCYGISVLDCSLQTASPGCFCLLWRNAWSERPQCLCPVSGVQHHHPPQHGGTNLGKHGQDWGYMFQVMDSEQRDSGKVHPFQPPVTCPENVG